MKKFLHNSSFHVMILITICRKADEIAVTLRQRLGKYDDIDVYTQDEIPEELHWAHNPYCPPILILAKVIIEALICH